MYLKCNYHFIAQSSLLLLLVFLVFCFGRYRKLKLVNNTCTNIYINIILILCQVQVEVSLRGKKMRSHLLFVIFFFVVSCECEIVKRETWNVKLHSGSGFHFHFPFFEAAIDHKLTSYVDHRPCIEKTKELHFVFCILYFVFCLFILHQMNNNEYVIRKLKLKTNQNRANFTPLPLHFTRACVLCLQLQLQRKFILILIQAYE